MYFVCFDSFETRFCVAEDDLELLILLPLPPRCWDYRPAPRHLVYVVLGTKPGGHVHCASTLPTNYSPRPKNNKKKDSIKVCLFTVPVQLKTNAGPPRSMVG